MHPTLFHLGAWPLIFILAVLAIFFRISAVRISRRAGEDAPPAIIRRAASLHSLATTAFLLTTSALVYFIILRKSSGITVSGYGAAMVIGFLAGTWLAQRRGRLEGIPERDITVLAGLIVLAALIGSRLFFFLFEQAPKNLSEVFRLKGGLVIYGGIITAALTAYLFIRRRGLAAGKIFDSFTPSLALGIFIGRLGCFMAGCCYGTATSGTTGMVFPHGAKVYRKLAAIGHVPDRYPQAFASLPDIFKPVITEAPYSPFNIIFDVHPSGPMSALIQGRQCTFLPVHPTQLYSSINGLVIFILLVIFYRKKAFDGEVFLWFASLYALTRFLIETVRIDTPHSLFFGVFSLSQAIGLLVFPVAVAAILVGRMKKHRSA